MRFGINRPGTISKKCCYAGGVIFQGTIDPRYHNNILLDTRGPPRPKHPPSGAQQPAHGPCSRTEAVTVTRPRRGGFETQRRPRPELGHGHRDPASGFGCRPSVTVTVTVTVTFRRNDIRTRTPVLRYYYGEPESLTEDPTPALLRACPGAGSQTARRRPRGSRLI